MFEDSTFESSNRIKKTNWWIIFTFGLNVAILVVCILVPLLSPESLPKAAMAMILTVPPPPPPPEVVHQVQVKPQMMNNQLTAPTKIPKKIEMVNEKEAPPSSFGVMGGMGDSGASGGVIGSVFGSGTPKPVVKVETPKKIAISSGVAQGNLISQTRPVYPPIAKAARVSGTVVLQATISKSGTIENLRVMSGNAMLQSAAMDAVRSWRYKPYLLNNEPVEVDTTINVVFNLGG
jgi:protein TonB